MVAAGPFFVRAFRSPVDPDRLRAVREGIVAQALARGMPSSRAWDLAAVADELLCNIEEHAGAGWIEISLEEDGGGTLLRLNDDGRDFDVAAAVVQAPGPEGRRERGLGLHLVRSVARVVRHRRTDQGANETLVHL